MSLSAPILLLSGLAAWLAAAAPAVADCDPAGPPAAVLGEAPVAFVGLVTGVEGGIATFAVSEVWAGDVGAVAQVRGLTDGAGIVEDDRTWTVGARYLVLPVVDRGALRDHICTATTEWRPELAELRPADARLFPGAPVSLSVPGGVIGVVAAGLVIVAVAGAGIVAFRARD